jgi:hypothetical protein
MHRRATLVLCGLVALIFFAPRPVLAFSLLWETQGSYVHQMAHLVFAIAMLFFIVEINRGELRGMPGVTSLVWACGLLVEPGLHPRACRGLVFAQPGHPGGGS